jgi:erythronate-4-phosphate dehydrogenase
VENISKDSQTDNQIPSFMISVLADKNLPDIAHFLSENCDLSFYDSNKSLERIPEDTQALLIGTTTKINQNTFPVLPDCLKFVGTGSAGTDHVDEQYLHKNSIVFADAAGCNARSVAEYVAVALLLWGHEHKVDLSTCSVGIIGAGHTGTAVQDLLRRLDVKTITYDPPREEQEPDFQSAALQDVLECDILTFHTPLTHKTEHPTFHWLDEEKLADRNFKLIINASRGGVVDEAALLEAHQAGRIENFILDVWENEPVFDDKTARRAYIKTPHIAGYSLQAKRRASQMLAEALTAHFEIPGKIPALESPPQKRQPPQKFWSLTDVLTYYHPILDYETRFRMLIGRKPAAKKDGFLSIRTSHKLRDEFSYLQAPARLIENFPALIELGFRSDGSTMPS